MSNIQKLKILLVEDTPYIVDQVNEALAKLTCIEELRTVDTEKDAMKAIDTLWPDVVICDLMLKQGNGFGILRTLKATPFNPVRIVLTNYALPNYREYAELLGVDYFLDKVKDFESLCEVVAHVHSTRRHLKD
jgi:CheY-like chemotaxis protein